MPRNMRLLNHRIRVLQATEPSNIQYQNLHFNAWDRCYRRFISACIYALVILISVVIVYIAQLYQRQNPTTSTECPQEELSLAVIKGDDHLEACYCDALGTWKGGEGGGGGGRRGWRGEGWKYKTQ